MYPSEFPLNFNKFTLDTHDLKQYLVTKFSVSARNIKQKRVFQKYKAKTGVKSRGRSNEQLLLTKASNSFQSGLSGQHADLHNPLLHIHLSIKHLLLFSGRNIKFCYCCNIPLETLLCILFFSIIGVMFNISEVEYFRIKLAKVTTDFFKVSNCCETPPQKDIKIQYLQN